MVQNKSLTVDSFLKNLLTILDLTLEQFVQGREDKTIESAIPFPAPEKGDNRGLSPFHPRIIIVIGECPLLSPV